jgi:hypothetical protein
MELVVVGLGALEVLRIYNVLKLTGPPVYAINFSQSAYEIPFLVAMVPTDV